MPASDERVKEICNYYMDNGKQATLDNFNIQLKTLTNIMAIYRKLDDVEKSLPDKNDVFAITKTLQMIKDKYSTSELKAIASGAQLHQGNKKINNIKFDGKTVKIGFCTDLHIGSEYFHENLFDAMIKEFDKEKVDNVLITGDVTEGMSNRPGHIYELTHLGYDAQKEYALQQLKKIKKPMHIIDGNHDRWYLKGNGALIVKDICENLNNATYLGHDEGDVNINGCIIKLWHGEDSSSYSVSYRLQKIVEAFTGGEKPNILLTGHTHKQGYFFIRNIHVVSGGAISLQSKWMRSKRLENHTGFWILEITIDKGCVIKFSPTWYPFYV